MGLSDSGAAEVPDVGQRPRFAGRQIDHCAYLDGVEIDFSQPGRPTDNAFIEAVNARFQPECPNASRFLSLVDARHRIEGN